MIAFLFDSFVDIMASGLLYPMCAIIFVFAVFRLTWFLLIGGFSNE